MAGPTPSHTGSSLPMTLGVSDQSCRECSRRKGRCDRQLPECGPCARNKRHCLYERHSRTPLTRKNLTELEARLRQTEARLRDAEQRAMAAEARIQHAHSREPLEQDITAASQEANRQASFSYVRSQVNGDPIYGDYEAAQHQTSQRNHPQGTENAHTSDVDWVRQPSVAPANEMTWGLAPQSGQMRPEELEQPPSGLEDFSWDEQSMSAVEKHAPTELSGDAGSPGITDSMASLSVDDKRAGYLGVASGAAMLRLMMPDAQHRHRIAPRLSDQRHSVTSNPGNTGWVPTPVWTSRRIYEIDVDAAINAYFSLYHQSYPCVHEATFRAQYAQVIPRPSGGSWNALAYIIAAIGLFSTATEPVVRDLDLFEAAKANISIDSLETGNITLVQALALMSNYIQKRGKPNSGYNYLGLALHMAMGLGMHKEFQDWRIAPLQMEIRRRVWWSLFNFYVGAAITFGRPLAWPANGIEVALPLNVDDRDLTNLSVTLPPPRAGLTTHSAIAAQARFHLMTKDIYARVISLPFPSAQELLQLDDECIAAWHSVWAMEASQVDPRFTLSRSIMEWRYRNLRIIMFRPFVIRKVLQARMPQVSEPQSTDASTDVAVDRCLLEAKSSIASIHTFWMSGQRTCMASWYALYFLFQATMIPSVCLRNEPTSQAANDWREQLNTALGIMQSMFSINPSSQECYDVVLRLCSDYLPPASDVQASSATFGLEPVEESPNAQIEGLYPMMWPGANTTEVDMLIDNDSWNNFVVDLPDNSPILFEQLYGDHRVD